MASCSGSSAGDRVDMLPAYGGLLGISIAVLFLQQRVSHVGFCDVQRTLQVVRAVG
jgi:hypothetical protein